MWEEKDWIAAMTAEPECAGLMGLFADWLDERGDARAGAFRLLWEAGKVGELNGLGGYWGERNQQKPPESRVSSEWFNSTTEDPMLIFGDTVAERFVLARSWATADDATRERWRAATLAVM